MKPMIEQITRRQAADAAECLWALLDGDAHAVRRALRVMGGVSNPIRWQSHLATREGVSGYTLKAFSAIHSNFLTEERKALFIEEFDRLIGEREMRDSA